MRNGLVDLGRFGPEARYAAPSVEEAREHCRRLARGHYENFTVASWLLPRELRPHFYHLYAWCRWADDLADETGDPGRSLALLDWWEAQLRDCFRGRAAHPVLVALTDTIERFAIPEQPFLDLLAAFRQDQRKTRYETFDELLDYCRRSANPVGRLVLYVGSCFDDENARLSDATCTGLQLANFWQDVAGDFDRGRIYVPRESQRRFGYDESMFARREYNREFCEMMRFEVDRAEEYFHQGRPLSARVPPALRLDVELFSRGGLAILAATRRIHYNVWRRRPRLSRFAKLRLFASAWLAAARRR